MMSTAYWPFNRAFDFGSFDLGMRIIVEVIIPMFSFCGVEHMAFFQVGHSMAHLWNYAMA